MKATHIQYNQFDSTNRGYLLSCLISFLSSVSQLTSSLIGLCEQLLHTREWILLIINMNHHTYTHPRQLTLSLGTLSFGSVPLSGKACHLPLTGGHLLLGLVTLSSGTVSLSGQVRHLPLTGGNLLLSLVALRSGAVSFCGQCLNLHLQLTYQRAIC